MFKFTHSESISESLLKEDFDLAMRSSLVAAEREAAMRQIFACLDLTTLEGSDTPGKVQSLCEKAIGFGEKGLPFPAAVCIYPPFISIAKKALTGTPIKVATTAAAFPSGQMVLPVKLAEIDYAVSEGADEIDVVISRGTFLDEQYETVFNELSAMRLHCPSQHLKVILETGELKSAGNIAKASEIAILAGADFIKTSTGKITPAATLEASYAMLLVIKAYYTSTGKKIGLKPAGGISDPDQAIAYFKLVRAIVGDGWLTPELFRIGASRLADRLSENLT